MARLLISAVFFAFGCFVSKLGIDLVNSQSYYAGFTPYEATISRSDHDRNQPRITLADYSNEGNLTYQYSYNGQVFSSSKINALTLPFYITHNSKTKYLPGSAIKIYLNPANPAEAVVDKGNPLIPWLMLGIGFPICFYTSRSFLLYFAELFKRRG